MTLRILRESKGFSQDYVGRVLGIEQNTYSKLENGQIKLTSDRIQKLAELYDVSPEILVGNDLPIVNYNNGKFSKGIVNQGGGGQPIVKELYEKIINLKDQLIEEKEKQITLLRKNMEEKEMECIFWKEFYVSNRNKN